MLRMDPRDIGIYCVPNLPPLNPNHPFDTASPRHMSTKEVTPPFTTLSDSQSSRASDSGSVNFKSENMDQFNFMNMGTTYPQMSPSEPHYPLNSFNQQYQQPQQFINQHHNSFSNSHNVNYPVMWPHQYGAPPMYPPHQMQPPSSQPSMGMGNPPPSSSPSSAVGPPAHMGASSNSQMPNQMAPPMGSPLGSHMSGHLPNPMARPYPFQLTPPETNILAQQFSPSSAPASGYLQQPLDHNDLAQSYPPTSKAAEVYQQLVYDNQNVHSANKVSKSHSTIPDSRRRTKTGCMTCRRRRVKCDERHPHCRNCQRSERICLGYDVIFNQFRLDKLKDAALERRILIASRFPKDAETNPDLIAENIRNAPPEFVLNTWDEVITTFAEEFAGDLDLLLDSEFISKIVSKCRQYLKSSPERIVAVAGEIQVMLRLIELCYPNSEIGISVLDSNIPLEKMRTSVDYHVIRSIITGIVIGPESIDFMDKISSNLSRATELVKCLNGVNERATLISNILYNTCAPRDRTRIATSAVLDIINSDKSNQLDSQFSHLFWEILQVIADGSILEDTFMDVTPLSLFASSDIRGVLLLLALHTAGSHSALPILQSICPKGLSRTVLEIGLMTR